MTIFVTGDIHGSHSIRKLAIKKFPTENLTRDDYVIILGDFGLVWSKPNGRYYNEEQYWLDWLEAKPWTTLFVDGNHENHEMLAALPASPWHGGYVHEIRPHVLHLMRGEIFDIDGMSFLAMGGATSHDIEHRTEGKSWWPQELPNDAERTHCIDTLAKHGNHVDYVLTHCPPSEELSTVYTSKDYASEIIHVDEYMDWLQTNIADAIDFRRWLFGHMHVDSTLADLADSDFICLYHNIVTLAPDGTIESI